MNIIKVKTAIVFHAIGINDKYLEIFYENK